MLVIENGIATISDLDSGSIYAYKYSESEDTLTLVYYFGNIALPNIHTIVFTDQSYSIEQFKSSFLQIPEDTIIDETLLGLSVGTNGDDYFFDTPWHVIDGHEGIDTWISDLSSSDIEEFTRYDDHVNIDGRTITSVEKFQFLDVTVDDTDLETVLNHANRTNQTVTGSDQDDRLMGGMGNDVVDGLGGTDTAVMNVHEQVISGYSRIDNTVRFELAYGYEFDQYTNIEYFEFSNITYKLDELDNAFSNWLAQDKLIEYSSSKDYYEGGAGIDTIVFDVATTAVKGFSNEGKYLSMSFESNKSTYDDIEFIGIEFFQFTDKTVAFSELSQVFSSVQYTSRHLEGYGYLIGWNTDDYLLGENKLFGGAGNDYLYGGSSGDLLFGGAGDDTIYTDAESSDYYPSYNYGRDDYVSAGTGNDQIHVRLSNNLIYGGEGVDTLHYSVNQSQLVAANRLENGAVLIEVGIGQSEVHDVENIKFADSAVISIKELLNGVDITDGSTAYAHIEIGGHFIGTVDTDSVILNFASTEILEVKRDLSNTIQVVTANGIAVLDSVERIGFEQTDFKDINSFVTDYNHGKSLFKAALNGEEILLTPESYVGSVSFLEYQLLGDAADNIIVAADSNDFLNLLDGNDAANGGGGQDVIDGGTGSNFLTGGAGSDTFFLDGRGGTITWSTVTDFDGDNVNIWGWIEGVSKLLATDGSAGAEGYKGATFHYDLNNDGKIDTSLTFSGLTLETAPLSSNEIINELGYLLFI